jgi:hypothetical protein
MVMSEKPAPSAIDVLSQLVSGPSLSEVAANALLPALVKLYPQQVIDPTLAIVATPSWHSDGRQIVAGPYHFESLTDALVRLALSGTAITLIDGEHFLTEQPDVMPCVQLPVDIEAVGALLNELAPLLLTALEEQQIDYWNETISPSVPRWHQLSETLQQVWNVSADNGWDADQRAMALGVFKNPDKTERALEDTYQTRTCLIDLDLGDTTDRSHLNVLDTAVLLGSKGERTIILTHSVPQGFQCFDSFTDLEKSLQWPLQPGADALQVQWRLFEPTGNFFDQQACALIALEAQAIGEVDFFKSRNDSIALAHLGSGASPAAESNLSRRFTHTEHALPSWLDNASPADQTRYSRHLLDLVAVQQQNSGKSFQSEIPDIQAFTLDKLKKAIDRTPTQDFKLQDVEITDTSVVVWGTFVAPEQPQTLTLSLVDLALQNLAGLPLGDLSVRYRNSSTPVPTWMTATYLKNLVTSVDIGKTYPQLLEQRLVEDKTQAARLQQLYSRQLPVELSLLALQHKIRGEAGIDEQGYRYVVAALAVEPTDRRVDGEDIVVRPLAFVKSDKASDSADEVLNMFVIGPRDADKGPCLLYRPLFDVPLLQYPSRTNLLYAIKHSTTLRQSVLAWLPDKVRFDYSQYVFPGTLPSVWTIPQLLIDPGSADDRANVTMSGQVIEPEVLASLFKTNTEALITLADRVSVSNVEARWATLKRGGWALFNAALPFLGRSVGTAAWIWQIMDDLQEVTDAQNQQQPVPWTALTDILLSLGMALAHRAATRKQPQRAPSGVLPEKTPPASKPAAPASIRFNRLADISGAELPGNHELSLHVLGALEQSSSNLGTVLDSLKVNRPEPLATAATEGPYRHLRSAGQKWYAKVGERWFEVGLNDNEDVQIIDTRQQPMRTGPLLLANARGQWFVDLRLRLRAGGLNSQRQKLLKQNAKKLEQKKRDIAVFDAGLAGKRSELVNVRRAMLEATEQNAESARQTFLDTLDAQAKEYSANIDSLKALNLLEAIPNYRSAMLERLSLQLFLMQGWIDETYTAFRESLAQTLVLLDEDASEAAADRSEPFAKMAELTQGIIDKIEFAHSRFAELNLLGKEAVDVARQYKARLPSFSLEDLKMLQITLGQELCLSAEAGEFREGARAALESLVEDASLNIQSVIDLSAEESFNQLGERVEAMNNLVEQFDVIDQRFGDLVSEYPQYVISERLEQVKRHVGEFHQNAVQHLSNLLREQRLVEPVAGPSKSSQPPARKIIKTRYKGTLVGQPRRSDGGQDGDLVDVVAPLTGKVIATFHEKTPGNWVERVPAKPVGLPRPGPGLSKSLQSARELLDELPAFRQRTQSHMARAQRNPTEIEEIYYLHATRLRDAMDKIDKALTSGNHVESKTASATEVRQQLESEATALYATGRTARIELTKQQPPTAARVEWLYSKQEVTITRSTERRRLKGPRKDYLLEYPILDKQSGKVLWYAHFHYANLDDPLPSFTAAHLKTVEQRRLGGAYVEREGRSNQELIAIHRSVISHAQAASLFFS